MTKVLDKVNVPQDLKGLSLLEMKDLAEEIREVLIKKVNETGGHMGPNLGIIEATIAIHRVFDPPKDKLVFDVSHQCYPHKILTGRKEYFLNSAKYHEISGFTNPQESEYDCFFVGHTSTGVSLATGLAKGRDLQKGNENVIVVVGDGSLSGGEALEGLDNASTLNSNIIVIVNDNEMSIAENHGGIYKNLALLRETNGKSECNLFTAMGFDYHYVNDGNDIEELISTFKEVKGANHPVLIHIHTQKGKGLKVAEENREAFHWILPNTLDGKELRKTETKNVESFDSITKDYFLKKKAQGCPILAITAGTPGATGFDKDFREKMGSNYQDVGIAEEHAVALASGVAKRGGKPVISILSSFVQRTFDQLMQDLALNSSPATILVNWGGISGADATHDGAYDISLICNIPNIVYLAPTCKEEYLRMLNWSVEQSEHPVVIRVPFGKFVSTGIEDKTDYSILNKFEIVKKGKDVAIVAVGNFFELGKTVKSELQSKHGINATLINPKVISGLDITMLEELKKEHKLVITLENGILSGGFGEKIASFYGNSDMKVLNFGGGKEFNDRTGLAPLYEKYHLTPELIVKDIESQL